MPILCTCLPACSQRVAGEQRSGRSMLILDALPLTVIGLSSHPRLKRERRHSWLASIVLRAEFELTEGADFHIFS